MSSHRRRQHAWSPSASPTIAPGRPANHGVLVVEDDATVAALIRAALTLDGFEVTHAGDCQQAAQLLTDAPPEVMLVDIGLPDGNGLDLVRRARATTGTQPTVIVLSGFRQEINVLRAFDAGADDFMTKPFSPKELVARVRLRGGR